MDIDPVQIEAGLEALSGVNFTAALDAFRTANLDGEITTAEDVASVVAVFVPDAMYIKDALVVLGLVVKAREQELIVPGQPENPAMARAERDRSGR